MNSEYSRQQTGQLAVGNPGVQQNPFESFFGTPNGEIKTNAYDRLASASDTLPDAYKGQSLFLRDTIEGFIREANEWYTTVALPWAYTDQQTVQWTEWRFNKTLATYVPHEGVSRMVTHSRSMQERHITRRGLAFMIEHGFWKTPAGQEGYARNVMGIKQSIQETLNYDVMNEILGAKRYARKWKDDHGGVKNQKVKDMLRDEVDMYSTVQKRIKGFDMLLVKYRQIAQRIGVKPNMLIVPPSFRIYYSMVPDERTQYWLYGPDGVLQLREGPAAVGKLQDAWIFETRLLDIYSDDEGGIDMLKRERTVGEYYVMGDPFPGDDHSQYSTAWLDRFVYREPESDDFVRVRFKDAFQHCQRFDARGDLNGAHQQLAFRDPFQDRDDVEMAEDFGVSVSSSSSTSNMKNRTPANVNDMFNKQKQKYVGGTPVFGRQTYEEQTFDKNRDIFLFVDNEGRYEPVTHFGQMEIPYFNFEDQQQQAITGVNLLKKAGVSTSDLSEVQGFIQKLENVPYHVAFTSALVQSNLAAMTTNGQRNIEPGSTDEALAKRFQNGNQIPEFKPNVNGGLNIPKRNPSSMGDLVYPPLSSSWPQVVELAERGEALGWRTAAIEAKHAVRVTRQFTDVMNQLYPTSPFVDSDYRSPWFSNPDDATTIWENIIGAPRPAVFLRVLPTSNVPQVNSRISSSASEVDEISLIAGSIPTTTELVHSIAGAENHDEISAIVNTLYKSVPRKAKYENVQEYEELLNDVLLLVANYKKNKKHDSQKQLGEARSNVRSIMRALNADWKNTAESANKIITALENISQMDESVKDSSKRNLAKKVVDGFRRDTRFKNTIDAVITLGTDELDTWAQFQDNSIDFRAFMDQKDLLVSLSRQLETYQSGITKDIIQKTTDTMDALVAKTSSGTEAEIVTQMNQIWKGLKGDLTKLGSDTLEELKTNLIHHDTRSRTVPTVAPTIGAYNAGLWIRAPLSASKQFVKSLKGVKNPFAMPSSTEPNDAHTKPVLKITSKIIAHPIYDAVVSSKKAVQAEHTTWLRSMTRFSSRRSSSGDENQRISSRNSSRRSKRSTRDPAEGFISDLLGNNSYNNMIGIHATDDETFEEFRAWNKPHSFELEDEDQIAQIDRVLSVKDDGLKLFKGNFMARWDAANNFPNVAQQAVSKVFLASENNMKQWMSMISNQVLPPARIILWRLWITHMMYSCIFMMGGYGTGATFYGGSNAELGDDVISQFHYANFTFYSKAMVFTPDNIFIAEDVFAAGYVRGCDVNFIRSRSDIDFQRGEHKRDIIATLVPYREGVDDKLPSPMDFTGVHHFTGYDASHDAVNPHYTSAPYYETIYNTNERAAQHAKITTGFRGRASRQNTTAFSGYWIYFNPSTSSFNQIHHGTGHWKGGTGRGAAKVRDGQAYQFKEQDWGSYNYASTRS